ncbi:unnamed protein product [Arctogadus glacialis]
MPNEDDSQLTIANNKIANLKKDIRRLSDELRNKESLLASVMDLAADQNKQIASLSAAFQDTVVWDPLTSTCHRPSSCSTPNRQPSWTEVVIRGRKSGPDRAPPPPLGLSNQYAALSGDNPAPSADAPAVPARSKADCSQSSTPADTAALQPLVSNNAAGSRHRILREAVLRRSGGRPEPDFPPLTGSSTSTSNPRSRRSPVLPDLSTQPSCPVNTIGHRATADVPPPEPAGERLARRAAAARKYQELSLTSLIIGDSILPQHPLLSTSGISM